MRWVVFILLLPLVFGYQLGDYTGGSPVVVLPGQEVNLVLPLPEGNNCLPVAVLFVKGGEDFPVIRVNGVESVGGGVHRFVLRGERVRISVESSGYARIEANSLFYCTRDPFIFIEYLPPNPITFGNYNYLTVFITNYGYSEGEVNLLLRFHKDLAPFSPVLERARVPAKSKASYTVFLLASPFLTRPSAHPRVCITYRDSIMVVKDCDGPIPASFSFRPLIKCVASECVNASNLEFELNGERIRPGDLLPERVLEEINDLSFDIKEITLRAGTGGNSPDYGNAIFALILIGVAFAVVAYVAFK